MSCAGNQAVFPAGVSLSSWEAPGMHFSQSSENDSRQGRQWRLTLTSNRHWAQILRTGCQCWSRLFPCSQIVCRCFPSAWQVNSQQCSTFDSTARVFAQIRLLCLCTWSPWMFQFLVWRCVLPKSNFAGFFRLTGSFCLAFGSSRARPRSGRSCALRRFGGTLCFLSGKICSLQFQRF